jgi:imidazolonepropionase-like amidohydrolase
VDGVDDCRRATCRLLRRGVDVVKIVTSGGVLWQKSDSDAPGQPQFTGEEVAAITEEAHRAGVPVASHAQGRAGIRRAVENGVDTIEHGTYVDPETAELLAETDTVLVPTLSTMDRRIREASDKEIPEESVDRLREVQQRHFESVATAHEHDVDVALGTDFLGTPLLPHGANALEAELLVEGGLPEMDAIRAATSVAARTVADDALGTVEPRNYADLVVLDRDPLADVSALQEVSAVYRAGSQVV